MKTLFLTSALAFSFAYAGDSVLTVTAGSLKGKATLVNNVLEDGAKYVRLAMVLNDGQGKTVNVLQESTYDKTGKPVRKLQTVSQQGGGAKQSLVVTFNTQGANVKIDQGGKTVTDLIPWPEDKKVTASSEFWFCRDQPKPGDISTYARFDLTKLEFVDTKCQYHGKRTIQVGGKDVEAHVVTMGDVTAYLDNAGDPYKLESASMSMVKK